MAIHSYGITKEQIEILFNLIDNGRTTASIEKLREWFPEALEPEWVEVDPREFGIRDNGEGGFIAIHEVGSISPKPCPFKAYLSINDNSVYHDQYKIESGRIWRRKS